MSTSTSKIIETSDNRFYQVKDATASGCEHLFLGVQVKRAKGEWIAKRGARTELVRKAATRIVEVA